jgi:hypothetical protein
MCGALVEVREAEENGGDHKRRAAAYAALQQVLHPGAEEEFFGHRGKEKYCHPAQQGAADSRLVAMGMDKAQRQPERNYDRREEKKLTQADFPVAPFQMEVESSSAQLANREKSIEARIDQKQFVQSAETVRPRVVKPAQIHGQPQHQQD